MRIKTPKSGGYLTGCWRESAIVLCFFYITDKEAKEAIMLKVSFLYLRNSLSIENAIPNPEGMI